LGSPEKIGIAKVPLFLIVFKKEEERRGTLAIPIFSEAASQGESLYASMDYDNVGVDGRAYQ